MSDEKRPPRLAQGREHVVATIDEIPPGTHKLVPIGRHGVGVYNVKGTFYAIANYCPHEGGPLCSGRVHGRSVVADQAASPSLIALSYVSGPGLKNQHCVRLKGIAGQ